MILIIAEKPSLARNIVAGIGGRMAKMSGYYEGEGFLVTWAFGHLFSLCDIEDYEENPPETVRWTMDNLPCFPEKFKFRIKKDAAKQTDAGAARQFELIKKLCGRPDVDTTAKERSSFVYAWRTLCRKAKNFSAFGSRTKRRRRSPPRLPT